MTSALPAIRIQDAWLLREHASRYLHELRHGDDELPDNERMAKIVGEYRKAWRPHEQKILKYVTDSLELSFRQNIIDVYIAPYFNAFSDPLVIGTSLEPDVFVDVLTHELLHRLLTDNAAVPFELRLRSEWARLFGERPYAELVHIAVFAVQKAVFLEVLKAPERLERDITASKENDFVDYARAWDYVDARGYKEVIESLRKSYKVLSQK